MSLSCGCRGCSDFLTEGGYHEDECRCCHCTQTCPCQHIDPNAHDRDCPCEDCVSRVGDPDDYLRE